jgi:hypothetical protein
MKKVFNLLIFDHLLSRSQDGKLPIIGMKLLQYLQGIQN